MFQLLDRGSNGESEYEIAVSEDVKKFLYAGCVEVILNGSKPNTAQLVVEASERFGQEKILVSLDTVDFLFKTKAFLSKHVHELLIMNKALVNGLDNITDIPYILVQDEYDFDEIRKTW